MKLEQMTQLAKALVDADVEIRLADDKLKAAKKHAMRLREETIPSAMQELGLAKLVLDTGQTIMVKQDVYASIPEDNKPKAYAWLEENDLGGIIKSRVQLEFARGELDKAAELVTNLESKGYQPEFAERVHPQTLKATLRELIAKGTSVPLDLFGARPVWIATIK